MKTVEIIEGTWEEVSRNANRLAGKHVYLVVEDSAGQTEEPDAAGNGSARRPRNLAEFLGDYIGCVEGTGEALSERTGERFTEYLLEKRRSGHL